MRTRATRGRETVIARARGREVTSANERGQKRDGEMNSKGQRRTLGSFTTTHRLSSLDTDEVVGPVCRECPRTSSKSHRLERPPQTHLLCSEGSARPRLFGGCFTNSSAMFLFNEWSAHKTLSILLDTERRSRVTSPPTCSQSSPHDARGSTRTLRGVASTSRTRSFAVGGSRRARVEHLSHDD